MRAVIAVVFLVAIARSASFEVASVRPDSSETGVDRIKIGNGSVIVENVSLRRLIAMAYDIPESRQYLLSGPDWLESEHFDIAAKYNATIKDGDVPPMLLTLLTERFKLATHRETRQISGYALIVGKNASKLKPAKDPRPFANFRALSGHAEGTCVSMPDLADRLSRATFQLDRPVVDHTNLTGRYDITLDWAPTDPIFFALEDQLGLKLEARKLPLEVLVIDHADKVPAAN